MNNEIKLSVKGIYSVHSDSDMQLMIDNLKCFLSEGGPLSYVNIKRKEERIGE